MKEGRREESSFSGKEGAPGEEKRSAETSRSEDEGDEGGHPDPAQGGRPKPCPCLRKTPVEAISLKHAPQTEQVPDSILTGAEGPREQAC